MTPRLAELLAAMVEAVLAAETVASSQQRATIRPAQTRRRSTERRGRPTQEERSESRAGG
jgi:hypothetical protein